MSRKYLIVTAANEKIEKFLISHWLTSLRENVALNNTEILVVDYGLSLEAKDLLRAKEVSIWLARRKDGLINNLRFLEVRDFLLNSSGNYEQVLICDSGDLIIQSDISHLFNFCQDKVRAVRERVSPNMDLLIKPGDTTLNLTEVKTILRGKPLINVGFMLFPVHLFIDLVTEMESVTLNLYRWGLETVLLNYILHRKGLLCELDIGYNFIPVTAGERYWIRDSKFFYRDGKLIPVVHNAGGSKLLRPIINFGYGKGYNKPRRLLIFLLRLFYQILSFLRKKVEKVK
uniref:Glycosyltransferase n=1 Tax=Fervidobacterium thailandense TaxID=1008305 RepID=A0A7C4W3F6_9BACT